MAAQGQALVTMTRTSANSIYNAFSQTSTRTCGLATTITLARITLNPTIIPTYWYGANLTASAAPSLTTSTEAYLAASTVPNFAASTAASIVYANTTELGPYLGPGSTNATISPFDFRTNFPIVYNQLGLSDLDPIWQWCIVLAILLAIALFFDSGIRGAMATATVVTLATYLYGNHLLETPYRRFLYGLFPINVAMGSLFVSKIILSWHDFVALDHSLLGFAAVYQILFVVFAGTKLGPWNGNLWIGVPV